jgi:hypothetical protein
LFDTTLFEESTPAWLNGIATTWKDHISSAGVQMFRSEFVMDLIVHCNALESNSYAIFSENDAETPAKYEFLDTVLMMMIVYSLFLFSNGAGEESDKWI